jgi:hypothetical protein
MVLTSSELARNRLGVIFRPILQHLLARDAGLPLDRQGILDGLCS